MLLIFLVVLTLIDLIVLIIVHFLGGSLGRLLFVLSYFIPNVIDDQNKLLLLIFAFLIVIFEVINIAILFFINYYLTRKFMKAQQYNKSVWIILSLLPVFISLAAVILYFSYS